MVPSRGEQNINFFFSVVTIGVIPTTSKFNENMVNSPQEIERYDKLGSNITFFLLQ